MDDLQPIKFNTSNLVVTEPFTATSTAPIQKKTCSWVNEKGVRAGQVCCMPTFNESEFCSAHTAVNLRRKRNRAESYPNLGESLFPKAVSEEKIAELNDKFKQYTEGKEDSDEEDEKDKNKPPPLEPAESTPTPISNTKLDYLRDSQIIATLQAVVAILAQIRLKQD
jgi:hypothetical protein